MSSAERPWSGRRMHFVGVGGAGMSGYARAARALGAEVSGSDRADSTYSRRLGEEGVLLASIGHDVSNVPAGDGVEVVYSSAVPAENPELRAARERGLSVLPRAELLGELTSLKRTIAVAGAHGKTTTASMIVHILRDSGLEPSWLIGSSVGDGLDNSYWAPTHPGDWLVVEADESDRSMLSLNVEIAVLTNVELDHHATFGSLAELREAFREFLALARLAVVIWDRPDLIALVETSTIHSEEGGHAPPGARSGTVPPGAAVEVVPFDVLNPLLSDGGSTFTWRNTQVSVTVPGVHNALNAVAALEATRLAGVDGIGAIAGFRGAGRRFQRVGETASKAVVVDDYAHHPTEIAATIRAARTLGHQRLVAVFQPHLYSRTALLSREFGAALALADVVVVLDVYAARESADEHPGVSGLLIARSTAEQAAGRPVFWLPAFEDAQRALEGLLGEGDLCLVMGAGDVDVLAHRLVVEAIRTRGVHA